MELIPEGGQPVLALLENGDIQWLTNKEQFSQTIPNQFDGMSQSQMVALNINVLTFSRLVIIQDCSFNNESEIGCVYTCKERDGESNNFIVIVNSLTDQNIRKLLAVCLGVFRNAYILGSESSVSEVQEIATSLDGLIECFELDDHSYSAIIGKESILNQSPRRIYCNEQEFRGFFENFLDKDDLITIYQTVQISIQQALLRFRRDELKASLRMQPLTREQLRIQKNKILAEQLAETHKNGIEANLGVVERFQASMQEVKLFNTLLTNVKSMKIIEICQFYVKQSKCSHLILKEFKFLEEKKMEYNTYEEFEEDVDLFYSFYMDNCPDFAGKKLIILEFLTKVLKDSARRFLGKDISNTSTNVTSHPEHNHQQLYSDISQNPKQQLLLEELDENIKKDKQLETRDVSLQTSPAEFGFHLKNNSEQEDQDEKEMYYEGIMQQAQDQIEDLQRIKYEQKLELIRQQSNEQIEALLNKVKELEANQKKKEGSIRESQNKWDKDRLLLEQKIHFLEMELSEAKKKSRNGFSFNQFLLENKATQTTPTTTQIEFQRLDDVRKELNFNDQETSRNNRILLQDVDDTQDQQLESQGGEGRQDGNQEQEYDDGGFQREVEEEDEDNPQNKHNMEVEGRHIIENERINEEVQTEEDVMINVHEQLQYQYEKDQMLNEIEMYRNLQREQEGIIRSQNIKLAQLQSNTRYNNNHDNSENQQQQQQQQEDEDEFHDLNSSLSHQLQQQQQLNTEEEENQQQQQLREQDMQRQRQQIHERDSALVMYNQQLEESYRRLATMELRVASYEEQFKHFEDQERLIQQYSCDILKQEEQIKILVETNSDLQQQISDSHSTIEQQRNMLEICRTKVSQQEKLQSQLMEARKAQEKAEKKVRDIQATSSANVEIIKQELMIRFQREVHSLNAKILLLTQQLEEQEQEKEQQQQQQQQHQQQQQQNLIQQKLQKQMQQEEEEKFGNRTSEKFKKSKQEDYSLSELSGVKSEGEREDEHLTIGSNNTSQFESNNKNNKFESELKNRISSDNYNKLLQQQQYSQSLQSQQQQQQRVPYQSNRRNDENNCNEQVEESNRNKRIGDTSNKNTFFNNNNEFSRSINNNRGNNDLKNSKSAIEMKSSRSNSNNSSNQNKWTQDFHSREIEQKKQGEKELSFQQNENEQLFEDQFIAQKQSSQFNQQQQQQSIFSKQQSKQKEDKQESISQYDQTQQYQQSNHHSRQFKSNIDNMQNIENNNYQPSNVIRESFNQLNLDELQPDSMERIDSNNDDNRKESNPTNESLEQKQPQQQNQQQQSSNTQGSSSHQFSRVSSLNILELFPDQNNNEKQYQLDLKNNITSFKDKDIISQKNNSHTLGSYLNIQRNSSKTYNNNQQNQLRGYINQERNEENNTDISYSSKQHSQGNYNGESLAKMNIWSGKELFSCSQNINNNSNFPKLNNQTDSRQNLLSVLSSTTANSSNKYQTIKNSLANNNHKLSILSENNSFKFGQHNSNNNITQQQQQQSHSQDSRRLSQKDNFSGTTSHQYLNSRRQQSIALNSNINSILDAKNSNISPLNNASSHKELKIEDISSSVLPSSRRINNNYQYHNNTPLSTTNRLTSKDCNNSSSSQRITSRSNNNTTNNSNNNNCNNINKGKEIKNSYLLDTSSHSYKKRSIQNTIGNNKSIETENINLFSLSSNSKNLNTSNNGNTHNNNTYRQITPLHERKNTIKSCLDDNLNQFFSSRNSPCSQLPSSIKGKGGDIKLFSGNGNSSSSNNINNNKFNFNNNYNNNNNNLNKVIGSGYSPMSNNSSKTVQKKSFLDIKTNTDLKKMSEISTNRTTLTLFKQ